MMMRLSIVNRLEYHKKAVAMQSFSLNSTIFVRCLGAAARGVSAHARCRTAFALTLLAAAAGQYELTQIQ